MLVRLTAPRPTLASVVANLLIVTGLGAGLYSAWSLMEGAAYQQAQKAIFLQPVEAARPMAEAPETVDLWASAALSEQETGVLGELKIANVDLDVMVGEGLDKETLRRAAGHLESSAKPGQPGNVVLLGHRDTFFWPLRNLKEGDIAELRTRAGVFRYRIETTEIVMPEEVDVKPRGDHAALMLVTCYPFYRVGPSPKRFVAQGRLIEGSSH
jgi:sortase A